MDNGERSWGVTPVPERLRHARHFLEARDNEARQSTTSIGTRRRKCSTHPSSQVSRSPFAAN